MPLRVYLVRHGETAWSRSGQFTSRTDLPLTDLGEQQARKLQEWLHSTRFIHVFTSPSLRARQTCELAGLGLLPTPEPDLAEWNYGDYEGQFSAAIRETQPEWNLFRNGCPHGETPSDVCARADRLIARLRVLDGKVALFSHGHFGRVLAMRWIGLPLVMAQHFLLDPGSFGILGYAHSPAELPVIMLWNAGQGGQPHGRQVG